MSKSRWERFLLWVSRYVPFKIPNGLSASTDVTIQQDPAGYLERKNLQYARKYIFDPEAVFALDGNARGEHGRNMVVLKNINTGAILKVERRFFDQYLVSLDKKEQSYVGNDTHGDSAP